MHFIQDIVYSGVSADHMSRNKHDGITWTKDITNPVITPMTELYEKLDWRDPYVFL